MEKDVRDYNEIVKMAIDAWRGKLLDLSGRNKLIRFTKGNYTANISAPDLVGLYDRMASGNKLTFRRPLQPSYDRATYSAVELMRHLGHPMQVTVGDIALAGEADPRTALRKIHKKAKEAMEEQGINMLYLCFGFVNWKEKGKKAERRAPLLLMPVTITEDAGRNVFSLTRREDEVILNSTLQYFFAEERNIRLPDPKEKDLGSGKAIRDYLEKIEKLVKDDATVSEEVGFGVLGYAKVSMYRDLTDNRERIAKHPFIRAILRDPSVEPDRIPEREKLPSVAKTLVLPADSSQETAVAAAKAGHSFVLEGPPGTGKSQTIANIIATLMADGKRVLFVSQKYAALDVVVSRLEKLGLLDFCLALHSYKSGKKNILKNIVQAMKAEGEGLTDEEKRSLSSYFDKEEKLGAYIAALHETLQPLGKSVYDIFSELEALEDVDCLDFTVPSPLSCNSGSYYKRINALEDYVAAKKNAEGVMDLAAWKGYDFRKSGFAVNSNLGKLLTRLNDFLDVLSERLGELGSEHLSADAETFDSLADSLRQLRLRLDTRPLPTTLTKNKERLAQVTSIVEGLAQDIHTLEKQKAEYAGIFSPALADIPFETLLKAEEKALKDLMRSPLKLPSGLTEAEKEAYLYKNRDRLIAKINAALNALASCSNAYGALEDELGLGQELMAGSFPQYDAAVSALLAGHVFPKGLTEEKISGYREEIRRLQLLESERNRLKEKVLENWTKDVFTVKNPAEALYRFDREWAFKRNLLHVCKKYYRGTLTEDAVKQLLQALSVLQSKVSEIDRCRTALSEAAGTYYAGSSTNWNAVIDTYTVFQQLSKDGVMTPRLRSLFENGVSNDRKSRLSCRIHDGKRAYDQLTALMGALGVEADLLQKPFTTIDTTLNTLREALVTLSRFWETVTPHLLDRSLSLQGLRRRLAGYGDHCRLAESVKGRKKTLQGILGENFDENDPACEALRVSLRLASEQKSGSDKRYSAKERAHLLPLVKETEVAYAAAKAELQRLAAEFPEEALCRIGYPALCKRVKTLLATVNELGRLIAVTKAEGECRELGLGDFIEAFETKTAKAEGVRGSMVDVYQKTFLTACYHEAKEKRPSLFFSKETHEALLKAYRKLDGERLRIAGKLVRSSVIDRFDQESFATLKALNKKTVKELPSLRKILYDNSEALLQSKLCFMMSPISVSYYLKENNRRKKDRFHFDAVIFDEASQIWMEDAIGAIYRADQVIIAGDINQLPPTAFFMGNKQEGESDDEDADSESAAPEDGNDVLKSLSISPKASLLDVCSDASEISKVTLLWHYRSRHEHLITPSNRMIYDNSLITFPTVCLKEEDTGVESVFVEGGHSEKVNESGVINRLEAERCLALVKEHIAKHPKRSLGIIAFGQPQQECIQELISEYRATEYRPVDGEDFFAESNPIPFFVKNLETVQGDERDTIIISLCHGRDENGRIQNNFGPVGQNGGERRLNVAITRAKINVKLVHSVHYHEIGVLKGGRETEASGLKMIREYIRFAEGGKYEATGNATETGRDFIVSRVAAFLRREGYRVVENYGCSSYTLDLAVSDPHQPDRMLAAIITDGHSCRKVKTVRDRELLRDEVLEDMHWKLYRVWSLAWMQDPEAEKKALLAFLKGLETASGEAQEVVTADGELYGFAVYRRATLAEAPAAHSDRESDRLASALTYILNTEAPIHIELLYQRMAEYLEKGAVNDSVRNTVELLLRTHLASRVEQRERFVYIKGGRILPRGTEDPLNKRPVSYICPEEWLKGILYVLSVKPLGEVELYRAVADSFGYMTGENGVRGAIDAALLRAFLQRSVVTDGYTISIVRGR